MFAYKFCYSCYKFLLCILLPLSFQVLIASSPVWVFWHGFILILIVSKQAALCCMLTIACNMCNNCNYVFVCDKLKIKICILIAHVCLGWCICMLHKFALDWLWSAWLPVYTEKVCISWLVLSSLHGGWDSVVSVATCYRLGGLGIQSQCGRDFLHLSRLVLEPTKPPVQWVLGLNPRGVMWLGRGVNHPPTSSHRRHHHHLALQPYVSLGLLCYLPPLVLILSFSSPSFSPHLSQVLLNVI